MAENAARAAALGAPGIDLNFGCPAKTVNRSQGGAALLRTPLLIKSICQAVRERVPNTVPVTAKIRLGYDTEDQFAEILDALAQVELSELTIHARTRRQGYRPPAHWHQLRQATQKMPYTVIANGELWSPSDVTRCASISGCDTFMLARGALCRPDLAAAIQGHHRGIEPPAFAWQETQELLIQFLERNQQSYDDRYAVNPVKQWLMYLRIYYPQAGALFNEVKRINEPTQMAQALMAPSRSEAA
jgi:tRNA-dihydrouridine synthase C